MAESDWLQEVYTRAQDTLKYSDDWRKQKDPQDTTNENNNMEKGAVKEPNN